MLYSSSRVKTITLEDILNRLTEYDIYAYYLGANFKIGIPFSSPFRRDDNPSFGIFRSRNGPLLYKDQGTGDTGNCVSFVQKLLGYPTTRRGYIMALEQIYNDIIEHRGNGHNLPKFLLNSRVGKSTTNANKTQMSVKRREWSDADVEYWGSFYIPKDTLTKFEVSPVQYVFMDDIIIWTHEVDNPIYVYKIYNSLKIYRPFAKSHNKWLSACTKYDIQGLEQLPPKGDLLVVTKSLKDVMVLHELNYPAIAPHGENHEFPNNIMYDLKRRFKRIIVLYDWDKAGIQGARKLAKEYKLSLAFIPQEHAVKDISDYVKKYTLPKGDKLLKELFNG